MATKDIRVLFNKLDEIAYDELDMEKTLEGRLDPEFNSNWARVYMRLMYIKRDVNYPEGRKQISNTYARRSFEKVMKHANCIGLASVVSDDMGLLYDGLTLKYEDPWFLKMVELYEQGKIPTGRLE